MNDLARLLHEATGEGECEWEYDSNLTFAARIPHDFAMPVVSSCICGRTKTENGGYWAKKVTEKIWRERKEMQRSLK